MANGCVVSYFLIEIEIMTHLIDPLFRYAYLYKGMEDLHLDERIMQVFDFDLFFFIYFFDFQ